MNRAALAALRARRARGEAISLADLLTIAAAPAEEATPAEEAPTDMVGADAPPPGLSPWDEPWGVLTGDDPNL